MFLKSLLACLSSRAVLSYGCSCIYKGKSGYICEGERCNGKELGREREREGGLEHTTGRAREGAIAIGKVIVVFGYIRDLFCGKRVG